MSSAIWSLRERPVWSFPPTAPIFSIRRRSMFMWMSSSSIRYGKAPVSSSARTSASPRRIASSSASARTPPLASARAQASLPRMSWGQSRWSKGREAVNARAEVSVGSEKRPPQGLFGAGNPVIAGRPRGARLVRGQKRRDLLHDPAGDVGAEALGCPLARPREADGLPEAHGERHPAGDEEAPGGQRLERPRDGGGDDGNAGPERDQGDAGLAADELPVLAERALREDAHHAALLEDPQRPADGARIRAGQRYRDRAHVVVEVRMERRGPVDARHDQEADLPGQRRGQHDAVQVVRVVRGDDERALLRQVLEPAHAKREEAPQHRREDALERRVHRGQALRLVRHRRCGGAPGRRGVLPVRSHRASVSCLHSIGSLAGASVVVVADVRDRARY